MQPHATNSEARNEAFATAFPKDAIIRPLFSTVAPMILDIGAHKGESITKLASAFPNCQIIAVEPNPELADALSSDFGHRTTAINKAVAATEGVVDFFVNEQTQTSSLVPVNSASRESVTIQKEGIAGLGEVNTRIEVESTTIDAIALAHAITSIDLLKIDVQGAEVSVLQGAARSLAVTSVIEVEISFFG